MTESDPQPLQEDNLPRLSNDIAVVTGGSGGLGSEIVRELVREGASVAILDYAPGDALANELTEAGATAISITVDVSDAESVRRAFAEVEDRLGAVSVLVNAAAIPGTPAATADATEEEFDRIFAINVKGTFLCTKYALKSMLASKRGSIVNISSIWGVAANDDLPLYHTTKAAVIMMAKTDGVTYATRGIRSNAIVLGSTRTPMALAAQAVSPEGDEYLKNIINLHPMKRQAEAVEVARVVAFLASDDASFVTATAIPVDGGFSAT